MSRLTCCKKYERIGDMKGYRILLVLVVVLALAISIFWLLISSSLFANHGLGINSRLRFIQTIQSLGIFNLAYPLSHPIFVSLKGNDSYSYQVMGKFYSYEVERGVIYLKNSQGRVWGFYVNMPNIKNKTNEFVDILAYSPIDQYASYSRYVYKNDFDILLLLNVDSRYPQKTDLAIDNNDTLSITWTDDRLVRSIKQDDGEIINKIDSPDFVILNTKNVYDE